MNLLRNSVLKLKTEDHFLSDFFFKKQTDCSELERSICLHAAKLPVTSSNVVALIKLMWRSSWRRCRSVFASGFCKSEMNASAPSTTEAPADANQASTCSGRLRESVIKWFIPSKNGVYPQPDRQSLKM